MTAKKRRPPKKTIKRVVDWLEGHQMSVYGPHVNLDHKIIYPDFQDFTAAQAIRFADLLDQGKMTEGDFND